MEELSIIYSVVLFVALTLVGVLVFYAINKVTKAEWVSDLYPTMQRITAPLWVVLLGLCCFYALNTNLYLGLRSVGYMAVWCLYRYSSFKYNVLFLVLFFLTETPMAWDWFPSINDWQSTLFGWQVLGSFLLSGVALVTLFSKRQHYHDLGKYLFGFSIFWAYLWFSQYMLIWYANIPEEKLYYEFLLARVDGSVVITMLVLSFVLPFFMLLSSGGKRNKLVLFGAAILILLGQYLNFYLMIVPFS